MASQGFAVDYGTTVHPLKSATNVGVARAS